MAKGWTVTDKKATDAEMTADEKFQMLIAALVERKDQGISPDTIEKLLAGQATAMQKAMKPENTNHPGFSAFRPKGGPDPVLPCQFFYNNYPASKFPETLHDRELELMARVVPGEFTVIRKDGSLMIVTVKGERDANQTLTKISVEFPISREDKWLVPPMTVVLYQLVYPDNPRVRFVEAMQEHFALIYTPAPVPVPVAV
jgi:hypothetical protein